MKRRELLPRFEVDLPGLLLTGVLLGLNGFRYSALLLLAAFVHEGGHLLCALILKRPLAFFRLGLMGARIGLSGELGSYRRDAAVAFWGGGANLLCLIPILFVIRATGSQGALFFFFANLALAAVNFLPARGLDGGLLLYSLLCDKGDWELARRFLLWGSAFSAAATGAFSFWLLRWSGGNLSLFLLCAVLLLRLMRRE